MPKNEHQCRKAPRLVVQGQAHRKVRTLRRRPAHGLRVNGEALGEVKPTIVKLKAGTFFADKRRIEKPKPGEPEAKQIDVGSKVKIQVTYTKIWNLEGIEGTAVSSTQISGPAPPIVTIRMTSGRDEDSVIIGFNLRNVTLIYTPTADL